MSARPSLNAADYVTPQYGQYINRLLEYSVLEDSTDTYNFNDTNGSFCDAKSRITRTFEYVLFMKFIPGIKGVAYGDPHFMTFDGNNYTFNGYGEFWLLWVDFAIYDSFNLQVRMTQPEREPRKIM